MLVCPAQSGTALRFVGRSFPFRKASKRIQQKHPRRQCRPSEDWPSDALPGSFELLPAFTKLHGR
jgi:hypothetical protein